MPFPTFEKKEDIPKGFESEFEEKDGKWQAKVPDATGLSSALEKERQTVATEKAALAAEKTARQKAENELAALKRKEKAAETGITEEQLTTLRKEDEDKRKPIEDENAKLKLELTKVKKTDRVQGLALKSGVMADRIEDAMLILEGRTGLTEDGSTITVLDKDKKLTTTAIEQFLKVDFKKEKPWLYAGSGGSGSGAGGSSGSADTDDEQPQPEKKVLDQKRAEVAGAF